MDVREPVRRRIAGLSADWSRRLGPDRVVSLDVLGQVSHSALTADLPMGTRPDGLPATFVPGRNLVFLTFAAIVAYQRGLKHVVAGVCETDFSGYPDCRDDTVKALQVAINLGMEARLVLETPLMWIDKADTWRLADQLGGQRAGRSHRRGDPHLLPGRPLAPPRLGRGLRDLRCLPLARQRLDALSRLNSDIVEPMVGR